MTQTTIEWVRNADGSIGHTVNPIRARNRGGDVGHFCEKISPGCSNCYASRYQARVHMFEFLPENAKRVQMFIDATKLRDVLARQAPTTYFWVDMADLFYKGVKDEWIDACVAVMAATRHHMHMTLTKRADRQREYYRTLGLLTPKRRTQRLLDAVAHAWKSTPGLNPNWRRYFTAERIDVMGDWPIPRLRVGTSIENQPTADERLPQLARTTAWDRYISYEPGLGPVTLRMAFCTCPNKPESFKTGHVDSCPLAKHTIAELVTRIIIGGESAWGARPFYLGWAKSMIRQCHDEGVAAFMKQLGSFPTFTPIGTREFQDSPVKPVKVPLQKRKGNDPDEWPVTAPDGRGGRQPLNLNVRQWPA